MPCDIPCPSCVTTCKSSHDVYECPLCTSHAGAVLWGMTMCKVFECWCQCKRWETTWKNDYWWYRLISGRLRCVLDSQVSNTHGSAWTQGHLLHVVGWQVLVTWMNVHWCHVTFHVVVVWRLEVYLAMYMCAHFIARSIICLCEMADPVDPTLKTTFE